MSDNRDTKLASLITAKLAAEDITDRSDASIRRALSGCVCANKLTSAALRLRDAGMLPSFSGL